MTERLQHVFVDQTSETFRHRTVSAGVLQRGEQGGEREMLREIPFPSQLCVDTGKNANRYPICFQGHQFLSLDSGPRFTPT